MDNCFDSHTLFIHVHTLFTKIFYWYLYTSNILSKKTMDLCSVFALRTYSDFLYFLNIL